MILKHVVWSLSLYLNRSREDYLSIIDYDKENGKVFLKRDGRLLGSITEHGLVWRKREGDRIINISLGKLCYFLSYEEDISPKHKIMYVDKDYNNLRPDNLRLVMYVPREEFIERFPVVAVEERIFFNANSGEYIVRRGNLQSIYRTRYLKEAIFVRDEWLKDKSFIRHDSSVRKIMRNIL